MENYFNYFTEIEEQFQRCRESPALLSTLDWALMESWKEAKWPLPAVRVGIERAFQKFEQGNEARKKRGRLPRKINSLSYCAQAVTEAVEQYQQQLTGDAAEAREESGKFSRQQIRNFLNACARALRDSEKEAEQIFCSQLEPIAGEIESLAAPDQENQEDKEGKETKAVDFEELEARLTALEDKLEGAAKQAASVDLLADLRREVTRALAGHRGKMSPLQIGALEKQLLKKRLFEHYRLPRLSLFYL